MLQFSAEINKPQIVSSSVRLFTFRVLLLPPPHPSQSHPPPDQIKLSVQQSTPFTSSSSLFLPRHSHMNNIQLHKKEINRSGTNKVLGYITSCRPRGRPHSGTRLVKWDEVPDKLRDDVLTGVGLGSHHPSRAHLLNERHLNTSLGARIRIYIELDRKLIQRPITQNCQVTSSSYGDACKVHLTPECGTR